MVPTRVKICGVCRVADALTAAHAGADAIGMIFHPPSRRNIPPELARQISDAVGPFLSRVGVFVDAPPDHIIATAKAAHLDRVQLHGRESADCVRQIADAGIIILKAIQVDERIEDQLAYWRRSGLAANALAALVLETGNTPAPGGTGIINDFGRIQRLQSAGAFRDLGLPLIAAGGLSPDNVHDVVIALRPYAVDVSSGVEDRPGEKSPEKIRQFIRQVRAADAAG